MSSTPAQSQRHRGDAPGSSEMALGLTFGSTVSYDTTVTSVGVNGWVTWIPSLYRIGNVHLLALAGVELGWGQLSRALPYDSSETHGLVAYALGGGITTAIGETEPGAHVLRGRVSFPIKSVGFGTGRGRRQSCGATAAGAPLACASSALPAPGRRRSPTSR